MTEYITAMPDAEQASLVASIGPAARLADAMQLNGAKVRGGDVVRALARLGLRLASVDEPGSPPASAAQARYAAVTESVPCGCGLEWVRLRDADDDGGAGWWHHGDGRYDDLDGFFRKCPEGNRAPRPGRA